VSEPPSGPMPSPREEKNPIFPMTLDLRFPAPGVGPGIILSEIVP
jgi:hypothetical protein